MTELTADGFEPHVGSGFTVSADDGEEITLELIEVHRYGRQPGAPRQDPFGLLFVGATTHRLPQATYELDHAVLGDLPVFLVPLQPGVDGRPRYEAVFN